MELDELADYCFVPPLTLLATYSREVRTPGEIPTYNKGWAYQRVSEMDRKDMSPQQRWKEDQEIVLRSLTAFAFLGQGSQLMPAQDELMRGLRRMEKTGETPFWLAFALQIYLDIHHLLRKEVRRGFHEARQHARRARDKINAYFAFSKELEDNPFWKANNDALFSRVCKEVELWFDNDLFGAVQNSLERVVSADPEDEFEFLKWHPLLMGLVAFNISLRVQELGRTLVNVWGSVIYPAYLYNAVQQEGVVDLHWPDMDKILEFHGEDKLFFGGKPKNLEESIMKVALTTGVSTQAMAAAKNGRKVSWEKFKSSRGQRGLEEPTVIADLFRDRYTGYGAIDFTVANVERVLNELAAADSAKAEGKQLSSRQLLKRRWEATQKLTPLQLLAALRERLVDEESKLHFDYLGMHQRGMDLLKALHSQEKDKLRQYFGADYRVSHDYELGGVVPYIFKVGINSADARQELGVDQIQVPGTRATSGMLVRAGQTMQEFLKEHGDEACAELRGVCLNKTGLTSERHAPQEQLLYWLKLDELIDPRVLQVLGQLR